MVFLMILVGVLLAAVLQELVFDRLRLRRERSLSRSRGPAPLDERVQG